METFCIKNVSCVYLKLIVGIVKTDKGGYFFFITNYFRFSVISGGAVFFIILGAQKVDYYGIFTGF